MNASDVNHVSNNYINQQDLSRFMTPKNVGEIKKAYANININRTTLQLKKLAEPQESGNAKRVMWYWLARNGFVEIPPRNYCEVTQSNPPNKDIRLKGKYVRRCLCGERPLADRCPGYAWWLRCNCGIKGRNGDDIDEAIELWNSGDVFFDGI